MIPMALGVSYCGKNIFCHEEHNMISNPPNCSTFNGWVGGLEWWFPSHGSHLTRCPLVISDTPLSNPLTTYPTLWNPARLPPDSDPLTAFHLSYSHLHSLLPHVTTLHLSSTHTLITSHVYNSPLITHHLSPPIRMSFHVTSTHILISSLHVVSIHVVHVHSYHLVLDA
jgi:hypothetical protein